MPQLKHKKQSRFKKLTQTSGLLAVLFIFLFAGIASYLVFKSNAENCTLDSGWFLPGCVPDYNFTNPAFRDTCISGDGLDIALLLDTSGSMNGEPLNKARAAMRTFIKELSGTKTYFAIGTIDHPEKISSFTNNQSRALSNVEASTTGGGSSYLNDVRNVTSRDPRPNSQNLIIILTDGEIGYNLSGVRAVQQAGTRILAIGFGDINIAVLKLIAGPSVNTGSIWTSDVITTGSYKIDPWKYDSFVWNGSSYNQPQAPTEAPGPEALDKVLRTIANQCKGADGGHGHGNGGTGTGTNGQGQGEGPSSGAGGGGGGSSANKQQEKPNTVPKAASQGETVEPPKPEPSPFFDGKEFKPGSDKDSFVFGSSSVSGHKVPKLFFYGIGIVLLGGAGAVVWRLWWQPRHRKTAGRKY